MGARLVEWGVASASRVACNFVFVCVHTASFRHPNDEGRDAAQREDAKEEASDEEDRFGGGCNEVAGAPPGGLNVVVTGVHV